MHLFGNGTTIRHFFLESPWLLIPALALAEYALLVIWLRRRTPRAKRGMLVGLIFLIVLPIIQNVIHTEQEKLRETCGALVRAVEAGSVRQVSLHVSPNFVVRDIDRDSFLAGVEKALATNSAENARLTVREIAFDGERAVVTFKVRCRVMTPDFDQPRVDSLWRAVFRKEGETWLLLAVDPQATPAFPFARLEQLLP